MDDILDVSTLLPTVYTGIDWPEFFRKLDRKIFILKLERIIATKILYSRTSK